mmetsp:Transcript_14310/g.22335  ORF Transcript_14310/g.22335 Transcript_14310/m.22335 type:complete len:539 (-) Transcript_14310:100-1716(-)|eukprot:CAMPEP_0195285930 /NCGR_PEP_ID=MMETSP0707-20130614/3582_1 /TAXON_ID=33640 /ORGANISM="Asterionellopsis glacialis, Strain CCMP134" /LENGTH=538 /DNA_ID=CAMNT_0040345503 /DNA_START=81 /DNA_END=1697 /DNA_ORIENTATION=-
MRNLSSKFLRMKRSAGVTYLARRCFGTRALGLDYGESPICGLAHYRTNSTIYYSARTNYFTCNNRSFSSVATLGKDSFISKSDTESIPFILADIGEGIAEVELLQWFVSPGDHVSQFDRICEVQSDKATVEITSRYDGTVEALSGKAGDMLKVGSPLLHISVVSTGENANDEISDHSMKALTTLHNVDDEQDKLQIPSVASKFTIKGDGEDKSDDKLETESGKVLATPAVRRLGMQYKLDLSTIMGTGPKGRVLKADVLKLLRDSGRYKGDNLAPESSPQQQPHSEKGVLPGSMAPTESVVNAPSGQDITVPIRGYHRLMVKSMTAALKIPHMVYSDEINMNALRACREELKPLAESHGIKLSYLPFCLKAASLAMAEYPAINSSLDAESFIATYHGNHNIGVAMDTARGLAVPVVKACQDLSILEIAKELNRLHHAASEGSLSESDISGATFSLSNIGAMGGTYMSPIVTPPQVAIGAMGKIQRLPRFVGDRVEEAFIMNISWGGDHRAIDGATMARFSNQWKAYMESPASMIFSLK